MNKPSKHNLDHYNDLDRLANLATEHAIRLLHIAASNDCLDTDKAEQSVIVAIAEAKEARLAAEIAYSTYMMEICNAFNKPSKP